ncbi:MAG: hypothetical protein JRI99_13300 [Deltaproteobacteria bacterium]|nr:hypothetical protein [Deltaproteobacteria bacterium]
MITLEYLYTQVEAVYANRSLSCEEKIIGFKDALYRTYQYKPVILKIIFHLQLNEGLLSLSQELLDKLNGVSQLVMEMIAAVYKEGVEKGIFIPGHKNAHADILWAVFTGLILWEDAKKQLNPKKDFLKSTLDISLI